MEVKNPKYTSDNIAIDIEINHPTLGWIVFTASPDDVEEHGRLLHEEAVAGNFGAIAATDSVVDPIV